MTKDLKGKTTGICVLIFCVLILVHGFEAIVLRMDETVFGENFINKVFGILVIWFVLRWLQWRWSEIGFVSKKLLAGIGQGVALASVVFVVAYVVEIMILKKQGASVSLGIFTTGFSLAGDAEIHTGIGFILMCIFFNIINVVMEEGTFRGLFFHMVSCDHSMRYALVFQAVLFGVWHIVTPFHNLLDGDINLASFVGLSIGYIILAGLMGIKWGLLKEMTGSLYAGMADHFCNNCIATNLLHVTTATGVDEFMLVRVLIAQVLSFILVVVLWKRNRKSAV